jgi:flagellar basal body L-ring protein FlgH
MKQFLLALSFVGLTGCSTVVGWIPSFWDDNQSAKITDVRQRVENIDCKVPQLAQATGILNDIQWFELYSKSKGTRQNDVLRIVTPMKETTADWAKRSAEKEGSEAYCNLKKRALKLQAERAAEAILGRY